MNTPSSPNPSTRRLLLDTGMQMARESGLHKLTVRGLAARAGVNPGSFVYHFGNRDAFLSELIETWYQPLFDSLQWQLDDAQPPLERLRAMVLQLMDFVIEHRTFAVHLLQDVAAGEPAAVRFLQSVGARHPYLLFQALAEAQASGDVVEGPVLPQMMFVMASLGGPVMLSEIVSGLKGVPPSWGEFGRAVALDREAICMRLDWALKGLKP
jgi:TetR/AcrR family transcriptional regulator, transcriptional repressor for nem operon